MSSLSSEGPSSQLITSAERVQVRAPRDRARRNTGDRAIVVGLAADIPRALEHPAVSAHHRFDVVGVVELDLPDEGDVNALRSSVEAMIQDHGSGTLLIAGPVGRDLVRALADLALVHQCRLLAIPPTDKIAGHIPVVVWGEDAPILRLGRFPRHPSHLALKRALDLVGAAVGLVLALPLLAVVAAAIRLESPGPVFFRHRRVGRNGRHFDCLKLRTMRADAETVLRADPALMDAYRRNHFKIPEHADPRITRLGRLLRQTSLDELPQLINVLRGEMSLVGPRPVVDDELEHFGAGRSLLLSVRPGLTGAWAVNGRHHTGYPKRAALELDYVRQWSLALDVRILARTARAVTDPGED